MTWQVEHAKLASHAPSNSTSFSLAISRICLPGVVFTTLNEPSLSLNENCIVLLKNRFVKVCRLIICVYYEVY